uniref:Uncharacterized protein n=1 Tax=Lutzomyia longipalpis TaxID=7200 RepID=A0A1B0CA04_LUTLO
MATNGANYSDIQQLKDVKKPPKIEQMEQEMREMIDELREKHEEVNLEALALQSRILKLKDKYSTQGNDPVAHSQLKILISLEKEVSSIKNKIRN